jgi:hypothetical protein
MTFDPNATPQTDAEFQKFFEWQSKYFNHGLTAAEVFHSWEHTLIDARIFCEEMESIARIAEEKLRIALVYFAHIYNSCVAGGHIDQLVKQAKEEIERVGK